MPTQASKKGGTSRQWPQAPARYGFRRLRHKRWAEGTMRHRQCVPSTRHPRTHRHRCHVCHCGPVMASKHLRSSPASGEPVRAPYRRAVDCFAGKGRSEQVLHLNELAKPGIEPNHFIKRLVYTAGWHCQCVRSRGGPLWRFRAGGRALGTCPPWPSSRGSSASARDSLRALEPR